MAMAIALAARQAVAGKASQNRPLELACLSRSL